MEALGKLAEKHPQESFTGVTWRTDDISDCEEWTVVYENGEPIEFTKRPKYNFISQVGYSSDKDFTRLVDSFTKHIEKYFERLDRIKETDDGDYYMDRLNNHKDENGFSSSYIIYWENDQYRFRACRSFDTMVKIDFERKEDDNFDPGLNN